MAEWSMAAVLKTVGRKSRGFESCSLRQHIRGAIRFESGLAVARQTPGACRTSPDPSAGNKSKRHKSVCRILEGLK